MTVKLFIGGLSPSIDTGAIQAHFQQFGAVADAIVMADRGFGFVTFESQEGADNALAQPQQMINGHTIDVKTALGKGGSKGDGKGGGGGQAGVGQTSKIFVGGLPQDCADEKIRDYFQRYGTIVDAVVMKDRDTGRSRGFGFIQYDNPGPVEAVMADYAAHQVEGKWVEVKRSVPRDQMPAPPPGGGKGGKGGFGGGCGGGYGGGCGGYGGGYGAPASGYGMSPAMYGGGAAAYGGYGGAYGGVGGAYGGVGGAYGAAYGGGYGGYPGYGAGPAMGAPAGYGAYGAGGKGGRPGPY